MSSNPFTPLSGATVGKTVLVTSGAGSSVSGTLDTTSLPVNHILVTADSSNTGTAFFRISGEAAASIAAAATDIPIAPGQSRIVMNPVPGGKTGLAVFAAAAQKVYFTPGEGGAS